MARLMGTVLTPLNGKNRTEIQGDDGRVYTAEPITCVLGQRVTIAQPLDIGVALGVKLESEQAPCGGHTTIDVPSIADAIEIRTGMVREIVPPRLT